VRLRCLGLSLVTTLTSVDLRREVVPGLLHLCRLSLSRAVRFTNRLQNRFSTYGFPRSKGQKARAPAYRFIPSPSVARTWSGPERAVLQTATALATLVPVTCRDGVRDLDMACQEDGLR
jgi:hypothetical protein